MQLDENKWGQKETWIRINAGQTNNLGYYCKTPSKLGTTIADNTIRKYGDSTSYVVEGEKLPEEVSLFASYNTHFNKRKIIRVLANPDIEIVSENIELTNIYPCFFNYAVSTTDYSTNLTNNKWSMTQKPTASGYWQYPLFCIDFPYNKVITFPNVCVLRIKNPSDIARTTVTYQQFLNNPTQYDNVNIFISNVPLKHLLENTFTDYDFINNVSMFVKSMSGNNSYYDNFGICQTDKYKTDNRLFTSAVWYYKNDPPTNPTIYTTFAIPTSYNTGFGITRFMNTTTIQTNILYGDWGVWVSGSNSWTTKYLGTAEDLLKDLMGLGLTVADNYISFCNFTTLDECEDNGIYTPEIKQGGYIDGSYLRGSQVKTSPLAKISENVNENTGFTGNANIDVGAVPTTKIPLNDNKLTKNNVFSRSYVFTKSLLNNFSAELYNPSRIDAIKEGLKLFGENPMNYIISLKVFPFQIPSTQDLENIKFGTVSMTAQAYRSTSDIAIFNFGTCSFPTDYTFRSFAPYLTAELYIPYVATIPLDATIYSGKTVNVIMVVDLIVGDCTTIIYADGIPVQYVNGRVGADIQVTGTNSSQYLSAIFSKTTDTINSVGNVFTNAVISKSPLAVAESGMQLAGNLVSSAFTVPQLQSSGSTSSFINFTLPQKCYIAFHRLNDISSNNLDYTSRMGFACNYSAKLKNVGGLIMCVNPDISIADANNDEKNEIRQYLVNGVFCKWE